MKGLPIEFCDGQGTAAAVKLLGPPSNNLPAASTDSTGELSFMDARTFLVSE